MLAMNGMGTTSLSDVKFLLTVWFSSPSSYEMSASKVDERLLGLKEGNVTDPSAPVTYFGGVTKQYAQPI